MTAVQPFLVHKQHDVNEPRNFLATAQCYGGTFQLFNIRYMQERGIECRWIEDPGNPETTDDGHGGVNSMLVVE